MATNEKIQLEGANKYKKDLKEIAAQSKALASEMKAVTSSFDKSTSAEEKNEKVGAQLAKQIDMQKQYVEKLTQAYEEEVKVSGEQSIAASQAKDALNKATAVLNNLERENRELIDSENAETDAVQKNTDAHNRWQAVGKAAAASIAAVAAAAAAAAKAIWDATNASGAWADNLLTLSAQTNVGTDTLQKWDYAARFIDTDTETMTKALAKVVKEQATAIKSGDDYIKTLDGQVISLKDANGEYKTSEQLFYEMLDTVGQIADETTREAAAQDLFGKSFQEMMPLINAGSEGLQKYGEEAEELGLVLGGDAVKALGDFDDQIQRLKATTEVAGRELALSFLPVTQRIAESLTDLASTVTTALADGFQDADVDKVLDALFDKLSQGLGDVNAMMPGITALVSGLVNKLIMFVTQNMPMLVQAALQIITGLANGLIQNLPTLLPAIVECIMTIVTSLTDPENINMLMDAAIGLIQALGQGLINSLPVLIQMMPQLVTNIVNALLIEAAKMVQVGLDMIGKIADGLAQGTLIGDIKQFCTDKIIKPFMDGIKSISTVGNAIVTGLWNGINDKFSWIKSQIKKWVGDVIKFFKDLLGIHSPSTVFEALGENIAQGLGIGIKDGTAYVQNALAGTMNYALDASPAGMGGVNVYIDGIKYNTDEYVDTSITNFVENMVRRGQMYGRA